MSAFGVGAAFLALLAAAFVAWPLWRRAVPAPLHDARRSDNIAAWRAAAAELDAQLDEGRIEAQEHERGRFELDRRLLAETVQPGAVEAREGGRATLIAVLLAVPLLAAAIYIALGSLGEARLEPALRELDAVQDPAERSTRLVALMPQIEAAAARRDVDGNYRFLLARSYMSLGRYAEAAARFAQLTALYPDDAGLLAQQAQALYLAGDRRLTPPIQALVDRAFAIDPAQVTLLGMVGMDRFQAGDYPGAVEAWQKLLARLPAEAPDAAVIREGIAMAQARASGMPAHADSATVAGAASPQATAELAESAPVTQATANAAPGAPSLRVGVRLDEGLSVAPEATVFVFARAVGGPPMPLAVARFRASELPREVMLDDSMAMAPGMSLSKFHQVTVTARVSRSGTVQATPGDAEGASGTLELQPGEQAISVVIDRTL